jgi:hypothetical protein
MILPGPAASQPHRIMAGLQRMNVSREFTGPRDALYKAPCETSGTVPYKREPMKVYLRRAVRAALNTGMVVNGRDH